MTEDDLERFPSPRLNPRRGSREGVSVSLYLDPVTLASLEWVRRRMGIEETGKVGSSRSMVASALIASAINSRLLDLDEDEREQALTDMESYQQAFRLQAENQRGAS